VAALPYQLDSHRPESARELDASAARSPGVPVVVCFVTAQAPRDRRAAVRVRDARM